MGSPARHHGPLTPPFTFTRTTRSPHRLCAPAPTLQRVQRACPGASGFADLQQIVGGVVQSHDESPRSDVVGKPGEADEDDGGHVVDDLLLEVLQERGSSRALLPDLSPRYSLFLPLTFSSPLPTAPSKAPRNQRGACSSQNSTSASRLQGAAPGPTFRLTSEAMLKSRDQ